MKKYNQFHIVAMTIDDVLAYYHSEHFEPTYYNFNNYPLIDVLYENVPFTRHHLFLVDCRKSYAKPIIRLLF